MLELSPPAHGENSKAEDRASWAVETACRKFRDYVKADEGRHWHFKLWNPQWETEYVDLLLRQGRNHRDTAKQLEKVCRGFEGKRVLEVACGFGKMAIELARLGGDVTAAEIVEDYLSIARLLAQTLPDTSCLNFVLGAAESLPLESDQFDVIWSDQTIEHVTDVGLSLKEMIRVLKPGGLLFVRCPNYLGLTREPHFATFWPPFLPRFVYRRLLYSDYHRRAEHINSSGREKTEAVELALKHVYDELSHINFIKPYHMSRILNNHPDFDWEFIRTPYNPARVKWKAPVKWLYYRLMFDVFFEGTVFLVGTKGKKLSEQLGGTPVGLWL